MFFEPRSLTSGRSFFFESYVRAFALADVVGLAPIHYAARLRDDERLDLAQLVRVLCDNGTSATAFASVDEILDDCRDLIEPGDVVVTMSSGPFEDLPQRLVGELTAAGGSPESSRS